MRPKKYKNLIKWNVKCSHGRHASISQPREEFFYDCYFETKLMCGCIYEFEKFRYIYISSHPKILGGFLPINFLLFNSNKNLLQI